MICHLGNILFQAGKLLRWDPAAQDVAHRANVKAYISCERECRAPWKLKRYP